MDSNAAFLASDVGRLFRKRLEFACRDLVITGPQWRALARIKDHPGINQGALASLLEVEAITVGRMVDRLEKLGFVERRPDASDRRVWMLHLTDKAEPVLEELRGRAETVLSEALDVFSPDENAMLVALLKRMRERLLVPVMEFAEVPENG